MKQKIIHGTCIRHLNIGSVSSAHPFPLIYYGDYNAETRRIVARETCDMDMKSRPDPIPVFRSPLWP